MPPTLRNFKRLVTLVVGVTILLIGVVMLVLPGPAMVVIPLGIVILAGEFAWARRLKRRLEDAASQLGIPLGEEARSDGDDKGDHERDERDDLEDGAAPPPPRTGSGSP